MASPHIGHDELVKVKTDKVTMIIKGPEHHPRLDHREICAQKTAVKVRCNEAYDLYVLRDTVHEAISPLFFEQQNYQLIVQYDKSIDLVFWHENSSIRERVTEVDLGDDSNKAILSGNINFANNIGFSDLVIKIDGAEYLTITLEVFPIKIDYQNDYQAIMDDLSEELYSLVFDFLRETYRNYSLGADHANTLVEFLEIIRHIFEDYSKSVDMIIRRPHHVLQTSHEVLPIHKAKRVDSRSYKWAGVHSEYTALINGEISMSRVMTTKKEITFDTKENQLAKFILKSTVSRLNEFKKNYLKMDRVKAKGPDKGVVDKINLMISGINRRLNGSFLKYVSRFGGQSQLSLVFTMAPGYRDLYRYYLMLHHGLSLTGDIFHMSVKDLADLYEYWCFVKLNSLLRNKYELVSRDRIRINQRGLFTTLVKDKSKSRVEYQDEKGEKIILSYNPSGKYPTGPQKPDNVLSLSKGGTSTKYEYVFDAKYRVNPAQDGTYYYKHISHTPGPEEDDINTMHRYRDAIVSKHTNLAPRERLMFGAYVLFPLSGGSDAMEIYKEHMFYKSIDDVNIGGLPFLPSSTDLVEDILDRLIGEPADDAYDRAPRPLGSQSMVEAYRALTKLSAEEIKAVSYQLEIKGITIEFPGKHP